MQKISYIITHRSSCPYRIINLYGVTDYLLKNNPNIEIIVVEQDSKPSNIKLPALIKHYFVYNDGLFNRSWGFNVGFTHASHDVLVFGDNDVILQPSAIIESAKQCLTYGTTSPYPKGAIIDLSLEATQLFLSVPSLERAYRENKNNSRVGPYAGGALFMTREAFNTVGGWEERIKGWGGEDDHMTIKINTLLQQTHEIKSAFALHLYHRANYLFNSPDLHLENPNYQINLACIEEIKNMEKSKLQAKCKAILPTIGKPLK